jgi:hypothetical protein
MQTSSTAAGKQKVKSSAVGSNFDGDRGAAVPCSELRKEKPHQESPDSRASRLGRERVVAEIKERMERFRSFPENVRESVLSTATTAASSESGEVDCLEEALILEAETFLLDENDVCTTEHLSEISLGLATLLSRISAMLEEAQKAVFHIANTKSYVANAKTKNQQAVLDVDKVVELGEEESKLDTAFELLWQQRSALKEKRKSMLNTLSGKIEGSGKILDLADVHVSKGMSSLFEVRDLDAAEAKTADLKARAEHEDRVDIQQRHNFQKAIYGSISEKSTFWKETGQESPEEKELYFGFDWDGKTIVEAVAKHPFKKHPESFQQVLEKVMVNVIVFINHSSSLLYMPNQHKSKRN